jgi:CheY-like chemotaxis protein
VTPSRLRIVLADALDLDLEAGSTFLQRRGFQVLMARDGLAAFDLAVSGRPTCVILDQFMPGLTGSDICAKLKRNENTRDIPVVIVSAHDDEAVRQVCQASGANAFVAKSEGRERLLEVVAKILHIRHRESARIPARMTVVFTVTKQGNCKETLGKALDLSEGGMCLEVNWPYEADSRFHLRFTLPEETRKINAEVRVCWTAERSDDVFLLGLKFMNLSKEARQHLAAHIKRWSERRARRSLAC